MGIQLLHRLLMATELIEEGNLFEYQVVTLLDEFRIVLQKGEPLGMGLLHTLVELVEFHEHAAVGLVKMEGAFHVFHRLVLLVLFIKACQCEVAPDGGERRIELGGQFPVADGEVVLTLVIVETPQIVWCTGTVGIDGLSHRQHDDILQTIGETAVAVYLFSLFEGRIGSNGIAQCKLCPTYIIIGEGVGG